MLRHPCKIHIVNLGAMLAWPPSSRHVNPAAVPLEAKQFMLEGVSLRRLSCGA